MAESKTRSTHPKRRSLSPKTRSIAPKTRSLAPKATSSPPRGRSIRPVSAREEVEGGAPAILVVEDDEAARRLIVRALRTLFTVYDAPDGAEALRILERVPPVACVVADVMMPGMDGMTLAKRMRADRRLKGVPLVFVTARGEPTSVLEGINVGARHYIQKPFKVKDLVEKIRAVVHPRG
jgi:CheY-like chemotaxis protein